MCIGKDASAVAAAAAGAGGMTIMMPQTEDSWHHLQFLLLTPVHTEWHLITPADLMAPTAHGSALL